MANTTTVVGFSLPSPSYNDKITTTTTTNITPVGSPPSTTRSTALLGITHNNTGNSNNHNTSQQQDFKSWFFHTASINQPEASGATSPRQLRRILRRAWKALEGSPYYKSLRSEHSAQSNSTFGSFDFFHRRGSRSAPGSPASHRRHRYKKKSNKSKSRSPLRRRDSESASDNEQTMHRPSTANAALTTMAASVRKNRPPSAASVTSTSSEGSESGNVTSGDEPSKKLIPLANRIFPSSKVRPKSGTSSKGDGGSGNNSRSNSQFSTIDETQASSSPSPAPPPPPPSARKISSMLGTLSSRRSVIPPIDEDRGHAQMVIDSSNASADTAHLVTIQEGVIDSLGSRLSSATSRKSVSISGKASAAKVGKVFADLKVIDETAKGPPAAAVKSLSSMKTKKNSIAIAAMTTNKKSGSIASVASEASIKTSSSGSQLAEMFHKPTSGPGAAFSTTSSISSTASHMRQASTAAHQLTNTAASLSALLSGGPGNKDHKEQAPSVFSTQDSTGTAADQGDDISVTTKGSSSKKSTLKKAKEDKTSSVAASDTASISSKQESVMSSSVKASSGGKESSKEGKREKKEKEKEKEKEGSEQGGTKKEQAKEGSAPSATAGSEGAATPAPGTVTSPTATTEGGAPAAEGAATGDDKAPLKREMSRISVKTNESRKSIDMSKHIMNLIHGGQAQEEQIKKPQTTNQSYIQQAIPALPMPAAVICLLLNLFAPGVGTILSGLLIPCIGKPRVEAKENAKGLTIVVNFFVGISQLMTVTFFFVGWFWSMVWGINMVINSVEYGAERKAEKEKELQQTAMRAFGFIRQDAAPGAEE